MFVILCNDYYHPSPEFFHFVKLKLNTQWTITLHFPFLPSPWQSLSYSHRTVPPPSPQLITIIKPGLRENLGLWFYISKYHSHPSQSSWTNIFWGDQMADASLAHPVSTLGWQQPSPDRFPKGIYVGTCIHRMAWRAAGWQAYRPLRRPSGRTGQRAFLTLLYDLDHKGAGESIQVGVEPVPVLDKEISSLPLWPGHVGYLHIGIIFHPPILYSLMMIQWT